MGPVSPTYAPTWVGATAQPAKCQYFDLLMAEEKITKVFLQSTLEELREEGDITDNELWERLAFKELRCVDIAATRRRKKAEKTIHKRGGSSFTGATPCVSPPSICSRPFSCS